MLTVTYLFWLCTGLGFKLKKKNDCFINKVINILQILLFYADTYNIITFISHNPGSNLQGLSYKKQKKVSYIYNIYNHIK